MLAIMLQMSPNGNNSISRTQKLFWTWSNNYDGAFYAHAAPIKAFADQIIHVILRLNFLSNNRTLAGLVILKEVHLQKNTYYLVNKFLLTNVAHASSYPQWFIELNVLSNLSTLPDLIVVVGIE